MISKFKTIELWICGDDGIKRPHKFISGDHLKEWIEKNQGRNGFGELLNLIHVDKLINFIESEEQL